MKRKIRSTKMTWGVLNKKYSFWIANEKKNSKVTQRSNKLCDNISHMLDLCPPIPPFFHSIGCNLFQVNWRKSEKIAVSSIVTTVRILSLSHSAKIHFALSMVKHQANVVSNIDFYSCRRPFSMTVLLSDHSQWFRMASFFFSLHPEWFGNIFDCVELDDCSNEISLDWLDSTEQNKNISPIYFDTYLALLLLHYGYCLLNARKDSLLNEHNIHKSDANNEAHATFTVSIKMEATSSSNRPFYSIFICV